MSLKIPAAIRPGPPDRPCCRVMSIVLSWLVPNAWASCARASCVGAVPLCGTARPDLRRRCCPSSVWHMAGWQRTRCRNVNFCQAYLQSAVWTYARCPGLVHRSCAAVCCRLSSAVSAGSSRLPRWFAEVPMSDRYSASRLMSVMLS